MQVHIAESCLLHAHLGMLSSKAAGTGVRKQAKQHSEHHIKDTATSEHAQSCLIFLAGAQGAEQVPSGVWVGQDRNVLSHFCIVGALNADHLSFLCLQWQHSRGRAVGTSLTKLPFSRSGEFEGYPLTAYVRLGRASLISNTLLLLGC